MSELDWVAEQLDYADERHDVIDSNVARVIAGMWHGGQGSPLYSFSSAGHIDADIGTEIAQCELEAETEADRRMLKALSAYCYRETDGRVGTAAWETL